MTLKILFVPDATRINVFVDTTQNGFGISHTVETSPLQDIRRGRGGDKEGMSGKEEGGRTKEDRREEGGGNL